MGLVGSEVRSAVILGAQQVGAFNDIFKTLVSEGEAQVREEHIPVKTTNAVVLEMAARSAGDDFLSNQEVQGDGLADRVDRGGSVNSAHSELIGLE